jgi:hypothetical protein
MRELYATTFAKLRALVRFVFTPQGPGDDSDTWW